MCLTFGEGGGPSGKWDMSHFWPDFFLGRSLTAHMNLPTVGKTGKMGNMGNTHTGLRRRGQIKSWRTLGWSRGAQRDNPTTRAMPTHAGVELTLHGAAVMLLSGSIQLVTISCQIYLQDVESDVSGQTNCWDFPQITNYWFWRNS